MSLKIRALIAPLLILAALLLLLVLILILKFNYPKNIATTAPPTTTTGPIPTMEPPKYLYKNTANYHWPLFSDNKTKVEGEWKEETGYGEGPFGFGSSVKLEDDQVIKYIIN